MALILRIFLHPRNQQQNDTTKQELYIETSRLHLKKKIPTTRKSQSKSIKSQNHLKKKQNNGQLVLVAVDATSGPAHIKFFVKAISSTHDEVALTKETAKKLTPPHNVPAIRKKTYLINNHELGPNFAARWRSILKYFTISKASNQEKQ